MQRPFTHGSLFSGIGGFDLAAEWMGWENRFHCEWNPFGQKVLKHYWPRAESFHDITKTDFTKYAHAIDVISGGFPCQPYSVAGKRLGKEDDRHLWPQMLRAIREVSPRWVVGENVHGLVNWDGGLVFHEVQADLEAEGYEVFPYVLPACGVGAPHRRDRIWFVAHASGVRVQQRQGGSVCDADRDNPRQVRQGQEFPAGAGATRLYRDAADAGGAGLEKRHAPGLAARPGHGTGLHASAWHDWPTQSPVCHGDDGVPARLDTSAIRFTEWRNESIKAGGNAIVPQVALQIFRAIAAYESLYSEKL